MRETEDVPEPPDPLCRPGIAAIFDVVHRLRAPDGCPWDREQTHESLRPYLLEETYELLEAIDSGDDTKIREELGDVLLQVALHAEIAAQEGRFNAESVSEGAAAKMVERHPHVYGDVSAADSAEVLRNWEHSKSARAREQGSEESVVDRVPAAMPALAWALGLQKRAARVGVQPLTEAEEGDLIDHLRQLDPVAPASTDFEAVGDALFATVSLARRMKINPEDALRVAAQRFRARFSEFEGAVRREGRTLGDLSAEEIERGFNSRL